MLVFACTHSLLIVMLHGASWAKPGVVMTPYCSKLERIAFMKESANYFHMARSERATMDQQTFGWKFARLMTDEFADAFVGAPISRAPDMLKHLYTFVRWMRSVHVQCDRVPRETMTKLHQKPLASTIFEHLGKRMETSISKWLASTTVDERSFCAMVDLLRLLDTCPSIWTTDGECSRPTECFDLYVRSACLDSTLPPSMLADTLGHHLDVLTDVFGHTKAVHGADLIGSRALDAFDTSAYAGERVLELAPLCILTSSVGFLKRTKDAWLAWVESMFVDGVMENADAVMRIEDMLKCDFRSVPEFVQSTMALVSARFTDEGIEEFVKWIDGRLKTGVLEHDLKVVTSMFRFIPSRDLFIDSYAKQAMYRLASRTPDASQERSVLSVFRMEMGASFTSKIEMMISDACSVIHACTFSLTRACRGTWPTQTVLDDFAFPSEMQSIVDTIKGRFGQANQRLVVSPLLGSVELKFTAGAKFYIIVCSPIQAACLLALDSAMPLRGLASRLNVSEDVVNQALLPMVFKHNLVINDTLRLRAKSGEKHLKRTNNADDVMVINERFSSKSLQIRVPSVRIVHAKSDHSVRVERNHIANAAMVRIMKSRKTMAMADLIFEAQKATSRMFREKNRFFKERVEYLISADYLERDGAELHYVA